MVAKPSELTPLSTLMLAECFADLPAGVVNLVAGAGDVGAALVDDERIDGVAFTGSVETGKKVAAACAARVARMNLEMGGKDPFIVCADVAGDVRGGRPRRRLGGVSERRPGVHVGRALLRGARGLRRLRVRVRGLHALASGGRSAGGVDRLGPMVSAPQRAKVEAQLEAAVGAGAELVVGGDRAGLERGHYLAPTVVTGAPDSTALLREETFGPVAPIVPVDSLDEAIRLANGTRFGLGANVYTRDLETAVRCMREIKAGTVWINDPLTDNDAGPFGGMKQSGLRARARPGGSRGLPGDQARPHGDEDRAEGLVVSVRPGLARRAGQSHRERCVLVHADLASSA